jgi:group I intron endonuclease
MPRKNFVIGIYMIRNTATDMLYIGSSAGKFGIQGRWDMHRIDLRCGKHSNPRLQASWNKHGEDVFVFMVIESADPSQLIEREQYWIDRYRSEGAKLYNMLPVAGSRLGVPTSDEAKRKLSDSLKGRPITDETIRKRCITRNSIYSFVAPDGTEHHNIVNLRSFADKRGLNSNALRLVWNGENKHHKGWVKLGNTLLWYVVTHRSSGEIVRLHKGQLRSFCIEHHIDTSNLLKILKGKLRYANNWTISTE